MDHLAERYLELFERCLAARPPAAPPQAGAAGVAEQRPAGGTGGTITVAPGAASTRPDGPYGPDGRRRTRRLAVPMIVLLIVLAIVVALVIYVIVTYNGLIRLKNRIEAAWAQIDVQLKRRFDLIPNLVETVKGYAAHERETLDAVITARNRAMNASGPQQAADGDNMITQALGRLFALSEAYPDLKANQNFQALQEELGLHRGQGRLCAAVLQRQRLQVQRQDPVVPGRDLRQRDGLQASRVLRGRRRVPRSRPGRVLTRRTVPVALPARTA